MIHESDYIGDLKQKRSVLAEAIAAGNAPSYDMYQRLVGQREGLQMALDILEDRLREDETKEL